MSETASRLEPLERRPLTDRTCLVTGSSRGIGRDIAFELARAGADVAVNYRSAEDRALEVTETIEANGEAAVPVQADISDPEQVERMAATVRDELGEIDVLVNNAGITVDRTFEDMTYEDWQTVIDVNLNGTFNCTNAFYEDVKHSEHGRLINISSVVGQQGNYGQANYATSKGGLFAFTRTLALELASHGSTANCVAPGFTETDMLEKVPERVQEKIREDIPLNRFATTEDIVGMVRFLASDQAEYMTGQVLGINGGMEW
ncbi:3-oxoacyl-ACP reductase FabG [Haloterrigena sp. SYSU A121-1]|uniref:3-oxoacyl-ACP reductase FabG n=1 Tax=Haloterrigena gelatinilytica TaxID=2741724 RepID=A0A8J8KF67_9EURY|nr:3-oxoacyl-ACP reductase family protein [Haloterrigena gelatinilytica]NUB91241.1 3-oxoacyl-ACP reductase FabG [Haloterrigena gelatinilytica]